MNQIPFNIPLVTGREEQYLQKVLSGEKFSGDGIFTSKCQSWLENQTGALKALLTSSCTHALELAAMLINVQPGDEIIMPSFTFVSTANAFVLRGAKIVFIDIDPATMNMDVNLLEDLITERTKAIVPVHYAGVGCDMDKIMQIAERHNLFVIEDAAQCIRASYRDKSLGSIGHMGTLSFHETKNIQCGEGGALLVNDERFLERAEIIREKGTNRKKFLRGEIDKYTWVDIGSSYLPDELNAAFLYAQLESVDEITEKRLDIWHWYYEALKPLIEKESIEIQSVPPESTPNGHLFYIKLANRDQRQELIERLREGGIQAVFHYIPLHSSKAGKKYGYMESDTFTNRDSKRLLRLPFYATLEKNEIEKITEIIKSFIL